MGFASVDETQQEPVLNDFVLSCRVAQKRVEHTFLQWLAVREATRGKHVVCAEVVRTDRNQPLLKVFDDLAFVGGAQRNGNDILQLPLDPKMSVGNIVTLMVEQDLQSALGEAISTR